MLECLTVQTHFIPVALILLIGYRRRIRISSLLRLRESLRSDFHKPSQFASALAIIW